MKRSLPFNEIRSMGYLIEGMEIEEIPIQRVLEAEHGDQYDLPECDELTKNPPIQSKSELIQILQKYDNNPWDENRLKKLQYGFDEMQPNKKIQSRESRREASIKARLNMRIKDLEAKILRLSADEYHLKESIRQERLGKYKYDDMSKIYDNLKVLLKAIIQDKPEKTIQITMEQMWKASHGDILMKTENNVISLRIKEDENTLS